MRVILADGTVIYRRLTRAERATLEDVKKREARKRRRWGAFRVVLAGAVESNRRRH